MSEPTDSPAHDVCWEALSEDQQGIVLASITSKAVRRYSAGLHGDQDYQDATQEISLRLARAGYLRTGMPLRDLAALTMTTAQNLQTDRLRSISVRRGWLNEDPSLAAADPSGAPAEHAVLATELCRIVTDLEPHHFELLVAHVVSRVSLSAYAQRTGTSGSVVRQRFREAVAAVRIQLNAKALARPELAECIREILRKNRRG